MAEETVYTHEELSKMPRLIVRRMCRARGMSSEDCAKKLFEEMVDWLYAQQEGVAAAEPKAAAKRSSMGKGKGKATATRAAAPAAQAAPEPEAVSPGKARGRTAAVSSLGAAQAGEKLYEMISEFRKEFASLAERLNTLGAVLDENFSVLVEEVGELRLSMFGVETRQKHLDSWITPVLDPEAAPEGMDFEMLEEYIEGECEGNRNSGEEASPAAEQ